MPKLKQMHFKDVRLPFRVERGRVLTDEATINGPYGKWVTTGGIGFDGAMDYVVSVTLPPDAIERLSAKSALAVGALSDKQGNLIVDLRVTGTAKAPRVTLDQKSMQNRLIGKASDALEEQKKRVEEEIRRAILGRQQASQDSAKQSPALSGKALEDSLKKAARDLFKGFFGGGATKKDTAKAAPDTTTKP
jgi:hypothetical protein